MDMTAYHSSLPLPDSAMQINGEYLERSVVGYRTLSVEGRESLDVDITETTVGNSDGSTYRRKRDQTRTLKISYALCANSYSDYHSLYNKLKSILHDGELKIIFKDESDVYYTGVVESVSATPIDTVDAVASQGDISIKCMDPYKYSVEEKTVTATLDNGYTFEIDYKGTRKAYPKIEAVMHGDNGFLALVNDQKKILQFGNPDEVDGENYTQNEYLCHLSDFANLPNDSPDYYRPYIRTGGGMIYQTYNGSNYNPCLYMTSVAQSGHFWTGACRLLTIPADSNGERGAKNFYCYMNQWFSIGISGQTGIQEISFLTDDNKVICGVSINKTDAAGEGAYVSFFINGDNVVKNMLFYPYEDQQLNMFDNARGHNCVVKEGGTIKFYYQGTYYQYTVPEVENMVCTKIQVGMAQWGERNMSEQWISHNCIRAIDFQKMYVTKWRDVPNKFRNGNKLTIECETANVYLNGVRDPSLGALANNWDNFYLKPGYNQIKFIHSTWATKPTVTLKYREVFL